MSSLQDQRVWLIGGSHGIGEALARKLIYAGADVVISGRSRDKLELLAENLGKRCHLAVCDVTDLGSLQDGYLEAKAMCGGCIDMVIYNAGAYEPMSAAQFDLDTVQTMLDVNLYGAIRMLHTILPDFRTQDKASIVLVGSVAGYRGLPNSMGYGMSKAAIIHLAENLRQDLEDSSVQVRLINPGFVKTRLTDKNDFTMPMMITPEKAAEYIVEGLESSIYEIHFPRRFTWPLKLITALPARTFFWLCHKLL